MRTDEGRRYHAYYGVDKNLMPTDEMEQDRLDLHHEIMLQLLDGDLHLAPLGDPQRILDIGTGTGIWAIDAADRYPAAKVIGTDLRYVLFLSVRAAIRKYTPRDLDNALTGDKRLGVHCDWKVFMDTDNSNEWS
jgi:tRNA G46 methylase TrmB